MQKELELAYATDEIVKPKAYTDADMTEELKEAIRGRVRKINDQVMLYYEIHKNSPAAMNVIVERAIEIGEQEMAPGYTALALVAHSERPDGARIQMIRKMYSDTRLGRAIIVTGNIAFLNVVSKFIVRGFTDVKIDFCKTLEEAIELLNKYQLLDE